MTLLNQTLASLSDPTTGLMTSAAYVFFLFREFTRFQKDGAPLSVVIFEIALASGSDMVPFPEQAISTVGQRVRTLCSSIDVVTHLGGGEFSVILTSADSARAMAFGASLKAAMTSGPLMPGGKETVLMAIGAASIPETCIDPEVLIAAARQAKELSKTMPEPCVLFPVMKM
jgi:PleD family two-component response regulator